MPTPHLHINTDGAARGNPGPAASAFIATQDHQTLHSHSRYLGRQTNNVAEYQGLILALTWLLEHTQGQGTPTINPTTPINIRMDSLLVVNQIQGHYRIKETHLQQLAAEAHQLIQQLKTTGYHITFQHIPRAQNKHADQLVNQELDRVGE